MEEYLRVGVVSNVHGVKGEVKVYPTTDDIDRFEYLKKVFLSKGREQKEYEVEGVKFFKGQAILKIAGVDDRDSALLLKGSDILVDRENAVELEEGEYFICDLVGSEVVTDEGGRLGELTDVLKTGANDVYVVKTDDGKEVLLPVIDECVLDIDAENKKITVHVMKGLI
ncbi:MAG: 16S rRNA processing protein RimM [Lachnospiraceae bacterium]|nr:16S rRNA processing protein RimM [Lachnospiraceae bacterium]